MESLAGLFLAFLLGFAPKLLVHRAAADPISYTSFLVYLGMIAGILISGEWSQRRLKWNKTFRKMLFWSIVGLALGIGVFISILYLWRDEFSFFISAYILPFVLPLAGALLGYELSRPPSAKTL